MLNKLFIITTIAFNKAFKYQIYNNL